MRIEAIYMSGTDFGAQQGPFILPLLFRELFKPFLKKMNDWVDENTTWKTFYHTCGSVVDFLDDFVEADYDILNPVQISARGMDPQFRKTATGTGSCSGEGESTLSIPFLRHSRRGAPGSREECRDFLPGEASYSTWCTTSCRMCLRRISWPCSRRFALSTARKAEFYDI
jgi:hypothetical protein